MIFLGFWRQLGWILASKLDPPKRVPTAFFPSCGQEASKRRPRGSKSVPRASQEPPTASQEGSKSAPERTRRAQGTPKVRPEGSFFEDFLFFPCFSAFSCFFLRFLGVFLSFSKAYPFNFFTPSSKQNCVRLQVKASKSKQKQAKGSQSKQEPPRVPKGDQNMPRARTRYLQRVTFLRISSFFKFFSVFSCGFLCLVVFFTIYPR